MKKLGCILLALICVVFCFAGCEEEVPAASTKPAAKENGFHVANALNADGQFAYRDGYIYFSDALNIYQYHLESGKTEPLTQADPSAKALHYPVALFASEDRVWYVEGSTDGLKYVTKDGAQTGSDFAEAGKLGIWFCSDGEEAYFVQPVASAVGTSITGLFHMDLKTGTATLLSGDHDVHTYSIGAERIYIVVVAGQSGANMDYELYESDRETVKFKKVKLSFEPVMTCPTTEGVYISNLNGSSYLYRDGKVTEQAFSTGAYYDVVGDNVIYRNGRGFSQTRSISCRPLELYNLKTGEKRVLDDGVWRFAVLEERYVCYWRADDVRQKWYYYDLQTGETRLMHEIEDSMTQYGYGID